MIFPIIRTVMYNNSPNIRKLYKNDTVKCRFCNQTFMITNDVVSVDNDGMQMVRCPYPGCGKTASVLYYFDRVVPEVKET